MTRRDRKKDDFVIDVVAVDKMIRLRRSLASASMLQNWLSYRVAPTRSPPFLTILIMRLLKHSNSWADPLPVKAKIWNDSECNAHFPAARTTSVVYYELFTPVKSWFLTATFCGMID